MMEFGSASSGASLLWMEEEGVSFRVPFQQIYHNLLRRGINSIFQETEWLYLHGKSLRNKLLLRDYDTASLWPRKCGLNYFPSLDSEF